MVLHCEPLINLAGPMQVSEVNGPGTRLVIWVQGCTLNCPGCFNQEFLNHDARNVRNVVEFAEEILEILTKEKLEGITLTGGEPFEQASVCAHLLKAVKTAGYSTVVFTGYDLEELQAPPTDALLAEADILIAGRFKGITEGTVTWYSNPNKQVHYLSQRYTRQLVETHQVESDVTVVDGNLDVAVTGFPTKDDCRVIGSLLDNEQTNLTE